MPFNMFGSVYRNQVFGTFNRQANCQGSPNYCGNPTAQLPGWLQQLEGKCTPRCMACLNVGTFLPTIKWNIYNNIVEIGSATGEDEDKKFLIYQYYYNNQDELSGLNFTFVNNFPQNKNQLKNNNSSVANFNKLFNTILGIGTFANGAFFTNAQTKLSVETNTITNNVLINQKNYMMGNMLNKIVNTQKKIQRVVGVPESEYISNLASAVVSNGSRLTEQQIQSQIPVLSRPSYGAGTWNQSSDRPLPAGSKIKKPTTGSSICTGLGVDVKHNSYARYLARLKGKNLKVKALTSSQLQTRISNLNRKNSVVNNKPLPLMIVQQAGNKTFTGNNCACYSK